MNIHTHPQKHTHTLKSKHNTILCSCRHSFDTITFLRVIMNLFRKLDCGNRWVWPRIHPQAENGWERKLRVSLCTPVREMPLPLYLSPSLAVFHDPVFPPPPPNNPLFPSLSLSFSHTPAASFDLWGPLEPWKAIPAFAVRQSPVENLLDVLVCPDCNPSCWHGSPPHNLSETSG